MKNGRERWKSIKRMARQGPVVAYNRYAERRSRLSQFRKLGAPECITEYAVMLAHDAGIAVRMSKSLATPEQHAERIASARTRVAEEGYETTPAEFAENLTSAIAQVRDALAEKGYPMPSDMLACRDLLAHLMRKATDAP